MKAKELMIGDWVYNPFTRKTLRLTFGRDLDLAEDLCLEPIPLTAEILEKNGFTRYRENEELWDVGVFRLDLGLFAVGIDNGCGTGMCMMPHGIMTFYCNYVHELQHALRLCGIEEDIIEL